MNGALLGGGTMHSTKGFLRISNTLVEALLRAHLTGAQFRIIWWVIRQTYGWNRYTTVFTWYRIAKETALDRATAYRAGKSLLRNAVLLLDAGRLGLNANVSSWDNCVFSFAGGQQLVVPEFRVAGGQQRAMSEDNTAVVTRQRNRCLEPSLLRQRKDSSKDRIKTFKTSNAETHLRARRVVSAAFPGAAGAVPGKYDSLS